MQNDICNGGDISSDAITSCMRTQNNTLSTWLVPNELEVDTAVLAIVSSLDHLATIDIVCLSQSQLEDNGLLIKESDGFTRVAHLVKSHRDITEITYTSLGIIAEQIKQEITGNKVKRYTVKNVKNLLLKAISCGTIIKSELPEDIRKKL